MPSAPNEHETLLAEGQAALLLGESILLALIEAKILDKDRVNEAIEEVIDAKRAMIREGKAPTVAAAAIGLLTEIANSLNAARDRGDPQTGKPR